LSTNQPYKVSMLLLSLGMLSRLIPHVANFSPLFAICVFFSYRLGFKSAILMSLALLLMSDGLISLLTQVSPFGYWSLFSVSALAASAVLFAKHNAKPLRHSFVMNVATLTLAFWGWTNLGVWLCSTVYAHTAAGLLACFSLALPFLQTSLISSLSFSVLIVVIDKLSHSTKKITTPIVC
jgi:hypothetical protein